MLFARWAVWKKHWRTIVGNVRRYHELIEAELDGDWPLCTTIGNDRFECLLDRELNSIRDIAPRTPSACAPLDEGRNLTQGGSRGIDRHRHALLDADAEYKVQAERDQGRQNQRCRDDGGAAPTVARQRMQCGRQLTPKNVVRPMPMTSVRRPSRTRIVMI